MNIGIITHHYTANYGAALQAFSLNRYLRLAQHNAINIDYRPWQLKATYVLFFPKSPKQLYNMILSRIRFIRFVREHIPTTQTTYYTSRSLRKNPPTFDAYVCGSDRIWNWRPWLCRGFNASYLFDFISDNDAHFVAYAPSFSSLEMDGRTQTEFSALLQRFRFLSAREAKGRDIINKLTGRDVPIVVDPTLLLPSGEFENVAARPNIHLPDKYCLVYNIKPSVEFSKAASAYAYLHGLPAVCVGRPLRGCYTTAQAAGPREWIWLFKHAERVCTDSFHGILLSIVFEKNFIAFARRVGNERLEYIAAITGLEKLLIRNTLEIQALDNCPSIDYRDVNSRLCQHIELSKYYLCNSLEQGCK